MLARVDKKILNFNNIYYSTQGIIHYTLRKTIQVSLGLKTHCHGLEEKKEQLHTSFRE